MRILRCCVTSSCVLLGSCLLFAQDGATTYRSLCASCHEAGVEHAPNREGLKAMSPERVLAAMQSGAMVPMAGRLSAAERRALAEFLTGKTLGQVIPPPNNVCTAAPGNLSDPTATPHWASWGATLENTRL
jgi:polyvinyl alcohol dehydrogenase (cytochrome)